MKLIGILLFLLITQPSFAMCGNSASDKNCHDKHIKDSNIMIGDTYSDPGGTKSKSAKESCCYEKLKDSKKYDKTYGGKSSGAASKQ